MENTLHLTSQKFRSFISLFSLFAVIISANAQSTSDFSSSKKDKLSYHAAFELGIKSLDERNAFEAGHYFKLAQKARGAKGKLKKQAKWMKIKSEKYFPEYFSFLNRGDQAFESNRYKDAIVFYKRGERILRKSATEKAVSDVDQKFTADIINIINTTNSIRLSTIQEWIYNGDNEMRKGEVAKALASYKKAKSHMYSQEYAEHQISSKIKKADSSVRYHQSISTAERALLEQRLSAAEKAFEDARHYAVTHKARTEVEEKLSKTIMLIFAKSMDKGIKAYELMNYSDALNSFEHARKYILKSEWKNKTQEVDEWLHRTNIRLAEVFVSKGEDAFVNKTYTAALDNFKHSKKYLVAAKQYGSSVEFTNIQSLVDTWISDTEYQLLLEQIGKAHQFVSEKRFQDALHACENAYTFARNNSDNKFIEEKKAEIKVIWQHDLIAQAKAAYFHGSLASLQAAFGHLEHARSFEIELPSAFYNLEASVNIGLKDAFVIEGQNAYLHGDFPNSHHLFADALNYFPNDQFFVLKIKHIDHLQKSISLLDQGELDIALAEIHEAKRHWNTTRSSELENQILGSINRYERKYRKALAILKDADKHPKQAKEYLHDSKRIFPSQAKKDNVMKMLASIKHIQKADIAFQAHHIDDSKALFSRSIKAFPTSYAKEMYDKIVRYEENIKRGDQFFENDPKKALEYYKAAKREIPTPYVESKYSQAKDKADNEIRVNISLGRGLLGEYHIQNAMITIYRKPLQGEAYYAHTPVAQMQYQQRITSLDKIQPGNYIVEVSGLESKKKMPVSLTGGKQQSILTKPITVEIVCHKGEGTKSVNVGIGTKS